MGYDRWSRATVGQIKDWAMRIGSAFRFDGQRFYIDGMIFTSTFMACGHLRDTEIYRIMERRNYMNR